MKSLDETEIPNLYFNVFFVFKGNPHHENTPI